MKLAWDLANNTDTPELVSRAPKWKLRDAPRDDATRVLWHLLGVFIHMVPNTPAACAFSAVRAFSLCVGRFLPVRFPAKVILNLARCFYVQASGSKLIDLCQQRDGDGVQRFLATRRSLGTPLLTAIANCEVTRHHNAPQLVTADKQHRAKLAERKKDSMWRLFLKNLVSRAESVNTRSNFMRRSVWKRFNQSHANFEQVNVPPFLTCLHSRKVDFPTGDEEFSSTEMRHRNDTIASG